MPSREELNAALECVRAVAEAIRDLGEVPSGHLFVVAGFMVIILNGH